MVRRAAVETLETRTLFAVAGDLDPTFSGDGRANFPAAGTMLSDVAVQADGKVLLYGQVGDPSGNYDLVLRRLLPDGTPDAAFGPAGGGGLVRIHLGANEHSAEVLPLPGGNILLAANTGSSTSSATVLRLLEDGSLDGSFGTGGVASVSPRGNAWVNDFAVQDDGKIVLAGGTVGVASPGNPAGTDALLARLLPDGAPDTGFGSGGFVIEELGQGASFSGLAVDSRGRLVTSAVSGVMFSRGDLDVLRYAPGGAPDESFGAFGVAAFPQIAESSGDVIVLPGDQVAVSYNHSATFPPAYGHAVLKVSEAGALDTGFGVEGFAVSGHYSPRSGTGVSELALRGNKIVLGATGQSEVFFDDEGDPVTFRRMIALQFDNLGRLDFAFGRDGEAVVKLDPEPETDFNDEWGHSVAVGPDDKIVLGGWGPAPGSLAAVRLLTEPPAREPVVILHDGTALVVGTPSGDLIDVTTDVVDDDPVVRVRLNYHVIDLQGVSIDRVVVRSLGGTDRVTVGASFPLPVHVDAGEPEMMYPYDTVAIAGTDDPDAAIIGDGLVSVGTTRVTLEGAEVVELDLLGGDDVIDVLPAAANGFVTIARGGAGDDAATVRSNSHLNFIGGDGDDTLSMVAGSGQFDGGAGDDSAFYQATNGIDELFVGCAANFGDPVEAQYGGAIGSEASIETPEIGLLQFQQLESLRVVLRGGDDRFYLDGRLRTAVTVDGGAGSNLLTVSDGRDPPDAAPLALGAGGLSRGEGYGAITTTAFEEFTLVGNYGTTSVVVTPDAATQFNVIVSPPFEGDPPSLGNRVGVDLAGGAAGVRLTRGEAPGDGRFEFSNRRPVNFIFVGNVDTVAARHVASSGPAGAAIAAGKRPLLPGQDATFANVTAHSRGINLAYLDVIGLPDVTPQALADSLSFSTSDDGSDGSWDEAPAPLSVTVARGAGLGGSDRVVLAWRDYALRNTWLRVTANATPATGLSAPDVFYVGNLVGDTGGVGTPTVNAIDLARTRANVGRTAAAALAAYDFNRDGAINAIDVAVVRANQRRSLPLFMAPATADAPAAGVFADGAVVGSGIADGRARPRSRDLLGATARVL